MIIGTRKKYIKITTDSISLYMRGVLKKRISFDAFDTSEIAQKADQALALAQAQATALPPERIRYNPATSVLEIDGVNSQGAVRSKIRLKAFQGQIEYLQGSTNMGTIALTQHQEVQ